MIPAVVVAPQATQVAPVSEVPDWSGAVSPLLYALIANQPFFKGLNPQQLQLLAVSALEVKFETGAVIFEEGSPANRFFLILTWGRATTWAGPGFFRPISCTFRRALWSRPPRYFSMGHGCASSVNKTTSWATKS